ncbi:MAG: two-component regulator propeller domain-containing protein [Bacteroidota bacterium]|nr:two-component regulator propeller domain-containing protein [Bacteroidota bacterium]
MYKFYTLLLLIIFVFFSCDKKQKQEKQKKEISFSPPVSINVSSPSVTLLDTCLKPVVMVAPSSGCVELKFPTRDGLKTPTICSPEKHTFFAGEAGGYTYMQFFNTEQGLALSTVCCGYKDRAGNLWFGTLGGGVSKYDGKSFTNYTSIQGLASNLVSCIIEDKIGNMWFGTSGGGVSKYDGRSFTNFTTEAGLANNRVVSISEDKNGDLWFSTDAGISKYDPKIKRGTEAKSFNNYTTAQGLLSNTVICSLTDKKGNVWFGTDKGVSKYTQPISELPGVKCFTNYTPADGLAANSVMCMAEDKTGNLWFGTILGGVSKYNPTITKDSKEKSFTNYSVPQGLPHYSVLSIIEDKTGNLWFGTGAGVSRYNPRVKEGTDISPFTNFNSAQGLSGNRHSGISEGEKREVWNSVLSITEDKAGSLWISNSMGGLSKYDGKSFTSFTLDQGLVSDKVWSIVEDKNENLWFVTSNGISKYDRKSFTNYRVTHIMSSIRCVLEDKMGNIWFGSGLGVTKYNGKSFTNYTIAQGLPHNTVLSIAEDKMGNLWFGTYGGGVSKYDGNRVEALERGEKVFPQNQKDLKKRKGKFVKSFTNFNTTNGLAGNTIKCIIEDKIGNMWFATNGYGISKYDGNRVEAIESGDKYAQQTQQDLKKTNGKFVKSFTNYSRAQGLSHNTIFSIMEDKAGCLWFGTAGGGVCKFDPLIKKSNSRSFTTFNSAQGLANDVVYAIVEDTLNNTIWFGTNLGLSGLKLSSLSSGTDGVKFENFNNKTGYPIKDVNTSALLLDKKGIIWAGTGDKLVRFDYSGIHKSMEPPAVFIQAVKIQGENIIWNNLKTEELNGPEMQKADSLAILNEEMISNSNPLTEVQREAMREKFIDVKFDSITRFYPLPVNLVLPFKNNNVTFDFAAIETTRPQLVRYQYFLEGYDNEWSPASDKTNATFGNIYEGTYTFKLKACSPEGIWSVPVTYAFEVLPPWYRTWWMYSLYILTFLSSIGLFFRLRTASLRKEKEVLERTVKERTTEVVEQKELIEEKQKEIVDSINYAKRIQYALLANDSLLEQNLIEHFILFQPKDIVSGDFYWATLNNGAGDRGQGTGELHSSNTSPSSLDTGSPSSRFYLAICDSTGHGVPGAFMSLLNISFLNEAITEKNIKLPNEILNHVRQRLIESVSQDGAQDGMDGILLCFENGKITYAAANNAPVILRDHLIINLPTDKMPIGKGEKNSSFTLHTIDTQKGDMLYFYTDGYADQFGGLKGKKFKYKQLEELLISIEQKSMEDQKQILTTTIENWKGNLEQVDDILIIGMRI